MPDLEAPARPLAPEPVPFVDRLQQWRRDPRVGAAVVVVVVLAAFVVWIRSGTSHEASPARAGVPVRRVPRKLVEHDIDRNTYMWSKVETDPDYHALVQEIWRFNFARPVGQVLPGMDTPEKKKKAIDTQIERASAAITKLRQRGVQVLFLRPPSNGPILEFEDRELPRAMTWDVLLQRTGTRGIHFEDYPELQGYYMPEWSHLSASEAVRFTQVLVPIVEREFDRTPR